MMCSSGQIETLRQSLEGTKTVLEDRNSQLDEVQRVLSMSQDELTKSNLHISELSDQARGK